MVRVKDDLTGRKFGLLTVICQSDDYINPYTGKRTARWLCECSCEEHKRVVVVGAHLKNQNTQSCGCLHKTTVINNNKTLKKKQNKYNLSGEFGVGWTTNTNTEFYFDLEDYDVIKEYAWREKHYNKGKYHALVARDRNTKTDIIMAWLITGKNSDHIDRNPLNNRRDNLRDATFSQNSQNRTRNSNNTSGIIGVSFQKEDKLWVAQLVKNYQTKLDKSFKNKEDAIVARLRAEFEYFGEFAPQRHLFEQYGIGDSREGENNNG